MQIQPGEHGAQDLCRTHTIQILSSEHNLLLVDRAERIYKSGIYLPRMIYVYHELEQCLAGVVPSLFSSSHEEINYLPPKHDFRKTRLSANPTKISMS